MPDVTRKGTEGGLQHFDEATEKERRRPDIGDDQMAETDPGERGQDLAPRRGEDVRDNVPGRYAAQGRSKWGRGEAGEQEVRKAAEREIRALVERRRAEQRPESQAALCEDREVVPFDDTCFEKATHLAQEGENTGAFVEEDSEENRRAAHAGELREGSPGDRACRRMPGEPKK
jgi:hypothetical protein